LLHNHAITLVIDCGANTGQYAQSIRRGGYEGRIVSFEPGSAAFQELARTAADDPKWICHNLALGDEEGVVVLNVAEESTLSSVYEAIRDPEISFHVAGNTRETVSVTRLDTVLSDIAAQRDAVHLKLDVQGAERALIDGAVGILPYVTTLECELPLVSLYEGQATLGELVTLLEHHGFRAVRIDPNYSDPGTGYCADADALFRRCAAPDGG
jgi:FkbM family methyltransferase